MQENYANSFSQNQSVKKESTKRNERIKTIETEIESWKNLLTNSEKMIGELNSRKDKLLNQLNELEKQPQIQAEKKGQISESLRFSEEEKSSPKIFKIEKSQKASRPPKKKRSLFFRWKMRK